MADHRSLEEHIENYSMYLHQLQRTKNQHHTDFALLLLKEKLTSNNAYVQLKNTANILLTFLLDNEITQNEKFDISSAFYSTLFRLRNFDLTSNSVIDILRSIKIDKAETCSVDYSEYEIQISVSSFDDISRINTLLLIGLIKCFEYGDVKFDNLFDLENFSCFMIQEINKLEVLKIEVYCFWINCVVKLLWRSQGRDNDFILECIKYKYLRVTNRTERPIDTKCLYNLLNTIPWTVKMKYYILLIIFKFCLPSYQILELYCQKSICQGFLISLRSIKLLTAGTELFRFYMKHTHYEQWISFSIPVFRKIVTSDDMIIKENFVKHWLPGICKTYCHFINFFYTILMKDATAIPNQPCPYLILSVLKICRKEGLIVPIMENHDEFMKYLTQFFNIKEQIRSEFFAVLCNFDKQSVLHSLSELKLTLAFLTVNLNTECTMLRKKCLSLFEIFLLRLRCSTIKVLKYSSSQSDNLLEPALEFLYKLNCLIISGLEPGCNYQSKVFSINLYKSVLAYLIPTISKSIRKNNTNDKAKLFVTFAIKHKKWHFSSDCNRTVLLSCLSDSCLEIKEIASELLIDYFDLDDMKTTVSSLFAEAVKLSENSLFYERECAAHKVQTLVTILYKRYSVEETLDILNISEFEVTSIGEFFLKRAESQINIMKKDIWKSALCHQADGSFQTLMYLITNERILECNKQTATDLIGRTVDLIEFVIPYLTSCLSTSLKTDYAPSFEEMAVALDKIINSSSIIDDSGEDKTDDYCLDNDDNYRLSNKQQLLLNYIWVTLKICSKLASSLITNKRSILNDEQMLKCANAVATILKNCRHKGAIEAAAVSLSEIVNFFTENGIHIKWIEHKLMELLNMLKNSSGCAISRRSGGHSLLIQNIIASDVRKGKPLLSICWSYLYEIVRDIDYGKIKSNILEELPETQALHFLKALVGDMRVKEHLHLYLEDIAILCLKTMSAPIWTIRNASLQLFGALLPKLVGQKIAGNTRIYKPYEELFLLMPRFTKYIIGKLEEACNFSNPNRLSLQCNIAPVLIILKSVILTSSALISPVALKEVVLIRKYIKGLLGSEIFFIRNLASKAYINLHSESEISSLKFGLLFNIQKYLSKFKYTNIKKNKNFYCDISDENTLHGYLLALNHLRSIFMSVQVTARKRKQKIKYIDGRNFSLLTGSLILQLNMPYVTYYTCRFMENFDKNTNFTDIGIDEMIQAIITNKIYAPSARYLPRSLNICDMIKIIEESCSKSKNYSMYVIKSILVSLKFQLEQLNRDETCKLIHIFIKYLVSCDNNREQNSLSLYFFELIICVFDKCRTLNWCYEELNNDTNLYQIITHNSSVAAIGLRLLCGFAAMNKNTEMCKVLLKDIYDKSVEDNDIDIRLNIAKALYYIIDILKDKNVECFDGVLLWIIIYKLLHDKDNLVSSEGINCMETFLGTRIKNNYKIYSSSSHVCLMKLFEYEVMLEFMPISNVTKTLYNLLNSYDKPLYSVMGKHEKFLNPFSGQEALLEVKVPYYVYRTLCKLGDVKNLKTNINNIYENSEKFKSYIDSICPFEQKYAISKIIFFKLLICLEILDCTEYTYSNSLKTIIQYLEEKFHFSYYVIEIVSNLCV